MSSKSIQAFQDIGWSHPLDEVGFSKTSILSLVHEDSILDIGCGSGLLLEKLREQKPSRTLLGLDISPKAIEACKQRNLDCKLFDITEPLPCGDRSFEAVLLIDVLEHMFQPEQILKEARRVSSKYVYISVPNFASLPARLQVLLGKVPENNTLRKGHIVWFTKGVLERMLRNSGLRLVEAHYNSFWQRSKITSWLARRWPSLFALSFVIKAEPL